MSLELSEQEIQRRESLKSLVEMGIDPYPAEEYPVTDFIGDIKSYFEEGKRVCIAGRLMSRRIMGKASFTELQDHSGRMQVYFNRDEICTGDNKELYNTVFKKHLDIGDILGIEGELFTTQVGEKSIMVKNFKLLAKALRPLPVVKTDDDGKEHHAFTDPELRFRRRYVDLIVNPKYKRIFEKRAGVFNSMRAYFNSFGYLEVDTPVLQSIPGGAAARPFTTHHNALDIPLYLRIANELYLKRLIVGGFDGVYEFSRNFRNEGMDRTHNPEFTVMEIYVPYKDYNWMMKFTENMLEKVAMDVNGSTKTEFNGKEIDFKAPYPRVTMRDAILEYTGFDINGKSEDELREACKKMDVPCDDSMGKGKLIDELFGEKCESKFVQPTFITDYPIEMSPLTKKHRDNPELTERFELMVCGKEVANAYSELNDPIDQRERFEEQLKLSEKGDDEAMFIDHDFLRALEYGMPPTSGMGIGIDRLVMFLTNNVSIQEVLLFPQMRPEKFSAPKVEMKENEKAIYDIISKEKSMELNVLKDRSGLSNKQWDKGIKGLSKLGVTKVTKSENETLVVDFVE